MFKVDNCNPDVYSCFCVYWPHWVVATYTQKQEYASGLSTLNMWLAVCLLFYEAMLEVAPKGGPESKRSAAERECVRVTVVCVRGQRWAAMGLAGR